MFSSVITDISISIAKTSPWSSLIYAGPTGSTSTPTSCILEIQCLQCSAVNPCPEARAELAANAVSLLSVARSGTDLQYSCPISSAFTHPTQAGIEYELQNMTCLWNGTWSPSSQLMLCKSECHPWYARDLMLKPCSARFRNWLH